MAAKLTLQRRVIRYMEAHGYKEVVSRSRKYRTFKLSANIDKDKRYFVGKSGAVRSSYSGRVDDARSITETIMKFVELWEKEQGL